MMMALRVLVALLLVWGAASASAQALVPSGDPDNSGIAEALQTLETSGNTIIVPPNGTDPSNLDLASAGPTLSERVAALREALGRVIANAPNMPSQLVSALRLAGNGSLGWLLPAGLLTVLAFVAGGVALALTRRIMLRLGGAIWVEPPDTRAGMIARDLAVLVRHSAAAGAFFVAGALAAFLVRPDLSPERVTAVMAVGSATVFLLARGVLLAIMAPQQGARRPLPFDDALASSLY
ncbi:MAG: hypothetical protein AAFW98_06340, partial [Pseudomonadota bacterium]